MKELSSILLIDDDPLTGILHKRIIEGLNISSRIEIADSGEAALQLIEQYIRSGNEEKIPQLILLDINMPFMDGYQFLEAYHSLEFNHKDSVVVAVLTTSFRHKDKIRVKEYQIQDYIEKPLTEERMMELMEQHFGWPASSERKK